MKNRKAYKKINIVEFSAILGVSTATVSRAFNDKGRISDETREMILGRASEVGYRPNVNARNLILKTTNTIAFFYPSLIKGEPDYFITEIMLGINETVSANHKMLQIFPLAPKNDENMDFYKNVILNGSVSGIIVIGGVSTSEELIEVAGNGSVPCIEIGSADKEKVNSVSFKLEYGTGLAGKYFNNIGRKHPVYVSGIHDESKLLGFKRGLGKLAADLVIDQGGTTFQHGSAAFERIYSRHSEIDAVLCANDIIAIGFMKAALSKGLRIPQDIAVIGCDDVKIARFYTPALTSIQLHEYDIGQKAVIQLERLIAGEGVLQEELIETDLIIRESA
jgi:DNA-binding LacI/PurR family transcriptional regulator